MRWLAERGLRGVSTDALVEAMRAGKERALVGISFDDGYASVLENAVPELLRREFTATMFIVSGLLGGTNEWDGGSSLGRSCRPSKLWRWRRLAWRSARTASRTRTSRPLPRNSSRAEIERE